MNDQDDDRDIEEMTPGDWRANGRWDASHTADPDLLLPYTSLEIAVWSHFHSVPVAEVVDHLLRESHPFKGFSDWAEQQGGDVTTEDFTEWKAGYDASASIMLCASVEEHLSEAEHMTPSELRQIVRGLAVKSPRLPVNNCVHRAAMYGSRTCCVCGADVPRRNPTLDDIPVLE